jgi:ribonucleoside-diphosphate reductase beta chain
MSKQQYNLYTKTDYLNRKMFLDPAGPVTIQRFEEVKYNKIANFETTARGFYWVPEEISLTKDAGDFKDASDAVKHIFTSNLLRQTALDSLQGRGPAQVFTPCVSLPELEALMYNWSFFETNIHSRSYSHIIRNIYNVPKDVFNTIHDTEEIVGMAASVGRYYDHLHMINCEKELEVPVNEHNHIKAIWLALHASYALEAFRFMVSFATSLAMVENRIFIG